MENIDTTRNLVPKRKRDLVDIEATAGVHSKAPPQKKARKTIVISDDLADTAFDSDDTSDNQSMSQPTLPSPASSDATWLIRADDPIQNQVLAAMVDSKVRAAYVQEVGNRTLYITNDPFPTNSKATDSAARPEIRVALKDRLINRLTWKACVPAYNANGGNVSDFAGVEKAVKQHAKHWFNEQDVVVPWQVTGPQERKRLSGLGLEAHHFPTLIAPVLNSTVTLNCQSVSKTKAVKTVQKNSSGQKEKTHGQRLRKQTTLTRSKESLKHAASNLATHEQQPRDHRSKQDYVKDKDDPTPLLIRDRIRATCNLYGKNVVEVKLEGASHWVISSALWKYCGAYSEQSSFDEDGVVDFGSKSIAPTIARAFFQAISPFPRNELPTHDVTQDPEMSLNHEDVALVILPDDPTPREIDWNFDACAEMYRLAVVLKSPVVKDMVADKILKIYLEYCEQEEEDKQSLDFPVDFANSLTMEEDLPLLRLLVDMALDQSRRGHGRPDGLAKHVTRLLEGRSPGWGGKTHMLYSQSPAALCNEYHGRGRPCHKAIDAQHTTEHLITDIFLQIRQETFKAATEELDQEDEQEDYDDTLRHVLDVYKMLLWSRDNEKDVALLMLEYERLATKMNAMWARDEEVDPEDEERAQWLGENITALRMEHGGWGPEREEEEGEAWDPARYARKLFNKN